MMKTFIDLHTHSLRSDGAYTPEELCIKAIDAGIKILAITDHNYTEDLSSLRKQFPKINLIQGCEISCMYTNTLNEEIEIHVIGLGFDPNHPKIQSLLAKNDPDLVTYIHAILERLRECNIDLGSYEDIQKRYPNSRKIGRSNVAKCMVDMGYVASVDEALDVYIGSYGEKRAYVPKDIQYVSIEEAISAIIEAGGVAVLAHLYYYGMSEHENDILVKRFKELSGSHGGMEVYYGIYTNQQREILKQIADKYQLMYSAASDYHGQRQRDCLDNKFLSTDCQELLKHLGFGKEWM